MRTTNSRFKPDPLSIALATVIALGPSAAFAQDSESKDATTLDTVQVTGSLIPRAQIETSAPTVTITFDDMKREGFKNVYEALRATPMSTGAVQDSQFTNGFTPGANVISMFGMDPGFTLYLVNGKPLADYPMLYNSSGTIVDLSGIPTIAVDHIDIVPGNQSAIYGSSAIAGVINIVTRKHVEGSEANLRLGAYSDGGGSSKRLQFITGFGGDRFDATLAVELGDSDPIYKYQRDYMDSTADNPTLAPGEQPIPSRDYLRINGLTGRYYDATQEQCANVASQFDGSVIYFNRAGFGAYCGSRSSGTYGTLMNGRKWGSAYGNATFQLSDNAELYGSLLYTKDEIAYTNGFNTFWWGTNAAYLGSNYIFNVNSGLPEQLQRVFAPEEVGTLADNKQKRTSYDLDAGIRGTFGESSWDYDLSYHRSVYESNNKNLRPLADKVNAFFLGEELDAANPYGIGSYDLNLDRFYGRLTNADILSFTDYVKSNASTYKQDLRAQITNTELFTLPAGSVGFAAVLQAGDQEWDQPRDPRVAAGEFWGTGSTGGMGSRDSYAAAAEFNVPITSMLNATLAGRWDKFKNGEGTGTGDKDVTYKLGLEFRPIDSLLIRGNYGTAFRAPEMSYVFADPSLSFSNVTDYWQCREANGNVAVDSDNCAPTLTSVQVRGSTAGNPNLESVTADSWGVGFVWSPTNNFNVRADYTRIDVSDKVATRSYGNILTIEADCRLGSTIGGTPVDINSGRCQEILSLITRYSPDDLLNPNGIQSITTYPLNVAKEKVANVNVGATYRIEAGSWGNFTFNGTYFRMLDHTTQTFPEDDPIDWLTYKDYGVEFKNIGNVSVTWDIGNVSATLFGQRYGKTYKYDPSEGMVGPWTLFNASMTYNFDEDVSVSLISNNIFNKRPPRDETFAAYPYYDQFSYNAFGRAVYLEFAYRFGAN